MTSHLEKLKQIEKLFSDTYLIVDRGIIKLVVATVIANRFTSDPVWLFIVAPSGGGKTEFISSINKVLGIYPVSTITSKTLISGKRPKAGEETSLLFTIGTNGILTFKDFTTMLTLQHEERNSIMGQFREIYDGSMTRVYGTGEKIKWKGKLGLIAGVTSIIHTARELYAAMGERFIMYSLIQPDRLEIADRAMRNTGTIQERRELIQDEMKKFLDEDIGIPKENSSLDEDTRTDILNLAELSTRARSPVDREWRSPNKDILYVHPPEVPTRFASQLSILVSALKVINGGPLLPEDKKIIFKIALDSITDTRRIALQKLAEYDEVETSGLATKINYPTSTVRRWLEDLNALKVIDRVKSSGKADRWKLKHSYRNLIRKFEGITAIGSELTVDTAEPTSSEAEPQPNEEQLLNEANDALRSQQLENQEPSSASDPQVQLFSEPDNA